MDRSLIMTLSKLQVLVVDDHREVARANASILEALGCSASIQTDPSQVENRLGEFDLVLLDVQMPEIAGIELLQRIKARRPQTGVIMVTVVDQIETAVRAIKAGAYNYLLKPLDAGRLKEILESFVSNRPPSFESFITQAPCFEDVFRRVRSFAQADVPVLIEGETGTGKELIARIVHTLSPRREHRFVAVNVAALPPTLFESELFGYRKGAFTGALQDSAGYFEQAGPGTLLLDEIGDVELDQQKRLLRVLQAQKYYRVGESVERDLRARLIFTTNRDLKAEVGKGRFREDLYFRLAAHPVRLPPLRERPGDIELLSQYFVKKYASQFGRSVEGIDPEALKVLKRHAFPGNVRELEGMISSAVLLENSGRITAASLPTFATVAPVEDLETARYQVVLKAMAECGGNQTRAAERLGIARQTLNRLLAEYRRQGRIA